MIGELQQKEIETVKDYLFIPCNAIRLRGKYFHP